MAEIFLWWPCTKIVQAVMIHQKTWLPGGLGLCFYVHVSIKKKMAARGLGGAGRGGGCVAYFPYICIQNLKRFLVHHWTDFNIIGDPKQDCSSQKHSKATYFHGYWSCNNFSELIQEKAVDCYCLVDKLLLYIQFEQWDSETRVSDLGPFGPLQTRAMHGIEYKVDKVDCGNRQ